MKAAVLKKFMKNFLVCLLVTSHLARSAAAQIVISEIHYHPVEVPAFNADGTPFLYLTNDVHEFVEIENTSGTTVDLGGWTLAGGITYTFPTNTVIASGAFRVIAKNPERLATVYSLAASNVLGAYSGYLGNSSDTVRVKNSAGDTIDAVTYDSLFPWAQSADSLGAQDRFVGLSSTNYQYKGRSLQRVSTSWASGDPANWLASPLSGPTPGAAQSVTRTIPKPVVIAQSAVQSSDGATIVRSNNAVTVNCTYSATNSLSSVTLEYFVEDINSTNETRVSVTMTNISGAAYTSAIPGQTNRAMVRYRFKANRGDGLEVVSPRADDPQVYALGTNGVYETWWGYFVTPVRTTTNSAIYDVFLSTAAMVRMTNNIVQSPLRVTAASALGLPRDVPYVAATAPQWTGTVPGVFACAGQVYDIQIRYHGSRYHRAPSNHSYKLHFPDHQPFNQRSSWFETLHGPEFIEATKINRLMGLPASQMRKVDWYFNAAVNEVHSEQGEYDGDMLDAYHQLQQQLNPGSAKEATGELYKDVGNRDASQNNLEGPYTRGDWAPMLTNAGWNQLQRFDWNYTLQNHGWKGSASLRDLVAGMWTARGDSPSTHTYTNSSATVPTVKLWFTNNWDIEQIITSMAVLEWISIWDDACQNQFYWKRANGKWGRLGWDYDGVMANNGGGLGGGTNQTIYGGEYGAPVVFDGTQWWKDTFYKTFRTEYQKKLWELNNSFFDPTNLTAQGFTVAATFAKGRQAYINTQLSSLGTYFKPNRPTNSFPVSGSTVISATNLVTSAYSHPQSTPHYATQWELRTAAGNFEEPLLRVTTTNAMLTSYPIPFDQLTYGQTYYWRATHLDTNHHPSVVSIETSFTWGATNSSAGALVINEILAYNRNTIQNGGKYPDYIELKNNSVTNLVLTSYALTDNPTNTTKYVFPAGTTILAGGYLLVWCDKDYGAPGLHAGFGLDEAGETVLLLNSGSIVDSVSFGPQAPDVSIGRIVNGTGGWQANTPTPLTANSAKTLGRVANLRVNEWMADPAYGEDWFELYNTDTNVVALASLWLSDTPSTPMITQIPALSFIEGNGYTKFWADGSTAGGTHANFKLAKSGESLVLTAANGATTLDTITFSSQTTDMAQGRLPDGASTIVTFATKNASPGYVNWAPTDVVINELLANSGSPLEDAIELYNTNTVSAADISGWWLSDDLVNRQKFQIPAGTTIPAGGYKVFYAADFAGGTVPFGFGAKGDEVVLSAVDGSGNLTGYGALVRFGASAENVSFGRTTATGLNSSSGNAEFWPLTAHTFGQGNPADVATFRTGTGAANATPKIGPVTINEIMYHPPDLAGGVENTTNEFIELANITTNAVDLSGWRLKGDTEFSFTNGTSLAAGGYLLLVSFNPSDAVALNTFRTNFSFATNPIVYGPYSEKLANSTFDVEISHPVVVSGNTNYVNVDKVEYRDTSPWPTTPDGGGKSLQRASSGVIGNTAANWTGNTPTPGAINLGVVTNAVIVTTSPLLGGVVNVAYMNTFAAMGGSTPYSWSIIAGSVPGLSLTTNGVVSGIPTTTGTNNFTVQLVDGIGFTTNKSFTLVIAATAPAITTMSPLTNGTVGAAYSKAFAAAGGTAPYAWGITGGSLPGGLTLNSAGVLSGTPTTNGAFNFTVQVTDANSLNAGRAFALTIAPAALAITTTSPMPGGQSGNYYSQALTGAGGVTPYSWSLASGTLPGGLMLSSLGDLTGTPTNLGTFNFTVQLTDNLGTNISKALAVTVVSPVLTITTFELPDGTVGAAYSQTLAASGGTPPYAWNIASSALPDGLNLSSNGVVSGTPTHSGTFSLIARVTDHVSATATKLFTIEIAHSLPTIAVQSHAGGVIQLRVTGDSGADYEIDSSANLVDWTPAFTTNSAVTPFNWSGPATNAATFYRVLLIP
jgi:hypothetical protein